MCGDITYVQVGAAWLYLACFIDIRSRRVPGYSMAPHMRAELVIDAVQAAVAARDGDVTAVIFHADRGSHHTSAAFAQVSDRYGIRRSMGRAGSSHDNALAESFWQGLKRETMHGKLFLTMRQARLEIFQWLTYYKRPPAAQRAGLPLPDGVRTAAPQDSKTPTRSINLCVHTPGVTSKKANPLIDVRCLGGP